MSGDSPTIGGGIKLAHGTLAYPAQVLPLWLPPEEPVVGWSHHYPSATAGVSGDMHALFEIGIILSGARESHFADLVTNVRAGEVWLSPGWEPHGWRWLAPDTRDVVVLFRPDFLGEERFGDFHWLSLFAVPPRFRPQATNAVMRQHVLMLGQELAHEVDERPEAWIAGVRQCLLRLLLTLRRGWEPPPHYLGTSRLTTTALERIMPAIELVCSDPSYRVTVAKGAKACSLSETQFRFLFRQTMATSFWEFAVRTRLAHATHLLGSTALTADAVAKQSGFTDASHLNRLLTRFHGCTVSGYRKHVAVVSH